jgi:hypothetical protein
MDDHSHTALKQAWIDRTVTITKEMKYFRSLSVLPARIMSIAWAVSGHATGTEFKPTRGGRGIFYTYAYNGHNENNNFISTSTWKTIRERVQSDDARAADAESRKRLDDAFVYWINNDICKTEEIDTWATTFVSPDFWNALRHLSQRIGRPCPTNAIGRRVMRLIEREPLMAKLVKLYIQRHRWNETSFRSNTLRSSDLI